MTDGRSRVRREAGISAGTATLDALHPNEAIQSNIETTTGRPCSVCSKPDRAAIEAMARTVSQAEACRRYGIAKGSMSRHMANHTSAAQAACSATCEPAETAPPPMIERSETPQGCLIAGSLQANAVADPALNAQQTHAKPIEAAPVPPTYPYPAASIMRHGLPMGARCRQCGGASWWQRRFDGYTACMTCYRPGGYSLPSGVAIVAT